MGVIHALVGLRSQSAQALLNLTVVNPYLETALRPAGAGAAAAWSLPRQAAGLPCSGVGVAGSSLSSKLGSGSVLATGISSFAFQVGCWSGWPSLMCQTSKGPCKEDRSCWSAVCLGQYIVHLLADVSELRSDIVVADQGC